MVKSQKTVVLCFCAVAILFVIAVVLSAVRLCGNDVHDNGAGADAVRNELSDARGALEEQGRILSDAQSAVADSERAADEIERIAKDDARIIDECRSILASIRARAET